MTDRTDEGRHPTGPGRQWEESYGFDFAATDGSVGGYVRLGLRPGDGVVWYWAAVVGPDRPLVLVRDHDVPLPRGRGLEVRASGLWADHTCETALEHWTVGLEAFGVALDDPREAFAGERGDRCPLGMDLEWEAADVARASSGGGNGGGGPGYEQRCTVHGEVLVGTERLEVDGAGWRTHRWGERDWWRGDPRTWAGGADQVDAVTDDDGLLVTGTVGGRRATPIAHAPVAIPGAGGRSSRLDRALCRLDDAEVGWIEHLTPPPPPPA
ncbi:MAG: hypothetical protein QOG43_966 [Actinomycetota bacterium]|jgi:hypothetical protein|nr:hypothetical protein [Actinomycetota bacterium]